MIVSAASGVRQEASSVDGASKLGMPSTWLAWNTVYARSTGTVRVPSPPASGAASPSRRVSLRKKKTRLPRSPRRTCHPFSSACL